jgi:hypothetical protein
MLFRGCAPSVSWEQLPETPPTFGTEERPEPHVRAASVEKKLEIPSTAIS